MSPCSDASRARGETPQATASLVRSFLLIENPGPWGPEVLQSTRLPGHLREALQGWRDDYGVRTLLIRRPGRYLVGPRNVFVVNAVHGWMQNVLLYDVADLLKLIDPAGFQGPRGVGLAQHTEPLVLVCTHGKHDVCCAVRGRPIAATLAQRYPSLVWESSHLGGDRFAGNVVLLPRGDYFGRLDDTDAASVVSNYLAGHLDLAHHRGRSILPRVAQAAEAAVRQQLDATGFDDVGYVGVQRADGEHLVDFLVRGEPVTARVRVGHQPPAQLTCHATRAESQPSYEVSL
ncbi:MAG: sucrase ferredoxin [Brooklawnia sp.]|jgi:hypothetical protein